METFRGADSAEELKERWKYLRNLKNIFAPFSYKRIDIQYNSGANFPIDLKGELMTRQHLAPLSSFIALVLVVVGVHNKKNSL